MDATLKQAGKILELLKDTPREQIQALVKSGLLADLRDGNTEVVNRDDFRKLLGLIPLVFDHIGIATLPAAIEPFIVREKFVPGSTPVMIPRIMSDFSEFFLDKIEDPMPETTIRYSELTESAWSNDSILEKLDKNAETTLGMVFALMELQKNGEEGILLTYDDNRRNIFYIQNQYWRLYEVLVHWNWDGWIVNAQLSIKRTLHEKGCRVFSLIS
ncbi:MAG: hypothetical protein KJI69_01695 [Patescibacteria group bacterium]|nr:hypothetical protein [Patescibacteria group bacterium]